MQDLGLEHSKPYKKSARIVGECFVKNTLILTEDGLRPIQDICLGDKVYTQKNLCSVTALYEMPPQKLFRVTLENGIYNEVTPSQKFKVLSEDLTFVWKEAKALTDKDYILVRTQYPDVNGPVNLESPYLGNRKLLNNNIAYLLGFFISDGWIVNDYTKANLLRLGWGSINRAVIEKVADILTQEFDYTPTIEAKKYKIEGRGRVIQNTAYTIRINRKDINEFFVKNFDLVGKNAFTKEIPGQIFISPKEVIFSFVSGLIEGDGSINSRKKFVHYGSVSKKLIHQLAIILQHLGIFSSRYITENFVKQIIGSAI
jgi:DNA gyrase subunit A